MAKPIYAATVAAAVFSFGSGAAALNVSPNIIFGTGNANGGFTVDTFGSAVGPIEVGLRAKLRFDSTSGCKAFGFSGVGCPQNIFNYDGNDTYTFNPADGNPPPGYAMWNFEWSVDVDDATQDLSQLLINGASAQIALDTDPGAGTTFVTGDPFSSDAYYGTRSTANGAGVERSEPDSGDTVAQQSVNYGFIPGFPTGPGQYDIEFRLFNFNDQQIGTTAIKVNVVPVPPALPMLAAAIGGLAWLERRHRKVPQG